MNRSAPLHLLGLLAVLAGTTTAQDPAATTRPGAAPALRVGTWNLEQLGWRKDPPRPADAHAKIARWIRELGVDVLAVQEIGGPEPLRAIAAELGPRWAFVLGSSGTFTARETGETTRISVGFLWNDARVELLQAEELGGFPRKIDKIDVFHRVPVSAVFRDREQGFDFRAVTVHLKAGRGADNERKRGLEARQLAEWFDGLRRDPKEDRDVLLLGDYNHTFGDGAMGELTRGGVLEVLDDANARKTPTILHFPEPIDHIALSPELRRGEYVKASSTVHDRLAQESREAWRAVYSDHLPVSATFRTAGDDDPDARFRPADPKHRLEPVRAAPAGGGARRP